MLVFNLEQEQDWQPKRHVEKILADIGSGDAAVACWEPGQISPYHCHPRATEIYFCFSGGGSMRTPAQSADVAPGWFIVHPPGELHEYANGVQRTLLFRVRYGTDIQPRHFEWPSNPDWRPCPADTAYFRDNPPALPGRQS